MSYNANGDDKGAAGAAASSAHAQAPKLRTGGQYASWRKDMAVYLDRIGAGGVHTREMTAAKWTDLTAAVLSWEMEANDAAEALAIGGSGSSSGSTPQMPMSADLEKARKRITSNVECSRKVYGIVYGALPDDLRLQVAHIAQGFAYGLWHWLEQKFQSTEQDSVAELYERWVALRMEDESYDAYRARVNEVFKLLEHAKEPQSPRMYAYTLLNKLQPRYKQIILALTAANMIVYNDDKGAPKKMSELPWDTVSQFINTHEREELRGASSDGVANAAWADAARGGPPQQRDNNKRSAEGAQPGSKGAGDNTHFRALSEVQCFNCRKLGHYQGECPEPRKNRSNRKLRVGAPGGPATGASAAGRSGDEQVAAAVQQRGNRFDVLSSDDESDDDASAAPAKGSKIAFSFAATVVRGLQTAKQESAKAAKAADKDKPKDAQPAKKRLVTTAQAEADTAAKAKAREAETRRRKPAAAVTAKPAKIETSQTQVRVKPLNAEQLDAALSDTAWGLDSMASVGASGNRHRFATLRKCPAVQIKTADGSIVTATHCGTVVLRIALDNGRTIRLSIDNVMYHERFASNLLSAMVLTERLGWEFHSTTAGTYLVTPGGNRVTLNTRCRIAVLMGAGPERVYAALGPGGGTRADSVAVDALVRLHARLTHMGFDRMIQLVRSGKADGLGQISLDTRVIDEARAQVQECRGCIFGKHARTNFGHRGLDRGQAPGEVLHMDTYPIKCDGSDGLPMVQYGISIMDLYSREGWHERVHTKDMVASAVIKVIRGIERQSGRKVKRIHSDGGSEFKAALKDFLAKEGIRPHWSPPATQQLNGGAERSVRTFKDAGRTLLFHAGAPEYMWHLAVSHAVWIWNRTQISSATGVTPYQVVRGKPPSLDARHIGVWGCDCFVHQKKEQRRNALSAKSEPGIYLGHDEEQNAARVLVLRTKKNVISRDVKFHTESFAHLSAYKRGEDAIAAVLDGSASLPDPDRMSDRMPAQGVCVQPAHDSASGSESRSRSNSNASNSSSGSDGGSTIAHGDDENRDPDEWTVESIVGRRIVKGQTEYKVRWAGFSPDDDTWEPERNVSDCAAYDDFMAARPAAAEQRRSPRFVEPEASASPDDDQKQHSRVEMAMCALRGLQTVDERPNDEAAVMSAVTAGIAAGTAALEDRTPKTWKQAEAGPDAEKWRAARQKEYDSCLEKGVWEVVPRSSVPKGKTVLPCKDVFKIKVDERGEIDVFKARFTPMGNFQKAEIDYKETFARTAMYKTERVCLSLAARLDNELVQFDVPTAFLNADVEEEVYMALPKGFGKDGMVCRLKKSLYGLKQAPRNWDKLIHGFITGAMGFKATISDQSFYIKRSRSGRLMMIYRFVDDMQGQYNVADEVEFEENIAKLRERFNIKKMSTATWMLGMRITRDRKARTIKLDQELYVTKALERYGLEQCKVASTPEVVGAATDTTPSLDEPAARQRYMEIVGTLMYAAISTRPDIAHAVHYLASNMQVPTRRHMQAAERVLRYLAGTKEVGLVFGSRNGDAVGDSRGHGTHMQVEVCAFADADWANDKGDRKSISGWVAKLNGDPVSWSSKKQRVVALSTCEAELYAEAAAIQEVLWLRGLMAELGLHASMGSRVYGDNQATIAVSQNGVKGERTKHVDVKYHFITETVESGKVKLQWVPTTQQQADIFTKALAAPVFLGLRKELMTR